MLRFWPMMSAKRCCMAPPLAPLRHHPTPPRANVVGPTTTDCAETAVTATIGVKIAEIIASTTVVMTGMMVSTWVVAVRLQEGAWLWTWPPLHYTMGICDLPYMYNLMMMMTPTGTLIQGYTPHHRRAQQLDSSRKVQGLR
jgi:hypothetical protein